MDDSWKEVTWNRLAVADQLSATVLMASGFARDSTRAVRERYEIVGTLGSGTMGQVLAVRLAGSADPHTYALKVLARPAEGAGPGPTDDPVARRLVELLHQEATKQDVVQRNGVAVARLFALVRLDDGSIGLRMEVARGTSLEARINAARQAPDEPPLIAQAVVVARKLVSQLRRMHELSLPGSPVGFVHSDIKPGNVFVDDTDPSELFVTLLDFGVATAGHPVLAGTTLAGSGARGTLVMQEIGGTLGYAPPKHFKTRPTPLSDIHAALVILYELITLQLPWELSGVTVSVQNLEQVEAAILAGPRPVRSVRPSIPAHAAAELDVFFRREFDSLHGLAKRVAFALDLPNDEVRDATRQLLSRLAREYQIRLDQLAVQLGVVPAPATVVQPAPTAAPSPDSTVAVPLVRAGRTTGPNAAVTSARPPLAEPQVTRALLLLKRNAPRPISDPPAPAPRPAARVARALAELGPARGAALGVAATVAVVLVVLALRALFAH